MNDTPGNGTTAFRLGNLERRMDKLEELAPDVAVLANELKNLSARVEEQAAQLKAFRLALVTWGFSVLGGAVIFALTTFMLLGKP